ncbi:MAG: helix-turn-helix domain-containing protein [Oscillospiraceae bacterium]|nr:helix-turn-helix domain-containing protein [Oscillospiraceae bacterium]
MNIIQNMSLLKDLISLDANLYLWHYDSQGEILFSNCPEAELLDTAFSAFGCKALMLEQKITDIHPIFFSSDTGLVWCADFEWEEDKIKSAFVFGPLLFSETPEKVIEKALNVYTDPRLTVEWKDHFLKCTAGLPVIPGHIARRYALMLHFCLTREKLTFADLQPRAVPLMDPLKQKVDLPLTRDLLADRKLVTEGSSGKVTAGLTEDDWSLARQLRTEQALLRLVRAGDLNYKETFNRLLTDIEAEPLDCDEPLRASKIRNTIFIGLVSHAAIDGGLPVDEALSVAGGYLQKNEEATTPSDVSAVRAVMYDDFLQRVHRAKNRPKLSPHIQRCCGYIEMNLDKKLRAKDLAELVGYTEYYLSQCFREETGLFINDFIKLAKIKRAKLLLISTDLSIQRISEELGFNTRSYFSQVFREIVGKTPVEYRDSCKV